MRCHPTSNLLAASFVETSEFDSMGLVYDIKYNQGLEIKSKITEGCKPFLSKVVQVCPGTGGKYGRTNKYEFPRDTLNVAFHPNDDNCLFIPYFDPHSVKRYSN